MLDRQYTKPPGPVTHASHALSTAAPRLLW